MLTPSSCAGTASIVRAGEQLARPGALAAAHRQQLEDAVRAGRRAAAESGNGTSRAPRAMIPASRRPRMPVSPILPEPMDDTSRAQAMIPKLFHRIRAIFLPHKKCFRDLAQESQPEWLPARRHTTTVSPFTSASRNRARPSGDAKLQVGRREELAVRRAADAGRVEARSAEYFIPGGRCRPAVRPSTRRPCPRVHRRGT